MTQEDKDLVLKDLCARLPYEVKVQVEYDAEEFCKIVEIDEITMIDKYGEEILLYHAGEYFSIEELKPYLRPMTSMSEKEKKELGRISCEGNIEHKYGIFYRSQDYLNSIHVDYRGLIEKGLALEAPEGMYK